MLVSRRLFPLTLSALLASTVRAAPATSHAGLLTILDGDAFLLRDASRFALAEGVALQVDDLLEVPESSQLARLELRDGVSLALGPGSKALVGPRLAGARGGARIYLLTGWLKLSAPQGVEARVLSPLLDFSTVGGTVVLSRQPDGVRLFAEAGEVTVQRSGAAAQVLKSGELFSLDAGPGAKPERPGRPSPAFVAAMPRAFLAELPSRAARWQEQPTAPRKLAALTYADAQPWIDSEPALRRANLARWRPMARDPEFRRGLTAGLKAHPEWEPILSPPPAKPTPSYQPTLPKP